MFILRAIAAHSNSAATFSMGTIPEERILKNNSIELLHHAAATCLNKSSYQCYDIGLLIYCGVYRTDYLLEPAYAALLAGELDMNATSPDDNNNKTLAFDILMVPLAS